jgi:hypothetical protein
MERVRAVVNGEQLDQRQKRSYSTFQLQVKDEVKVRGRAIDDGEQLGRR